MSKVKLKTFPVNANTEEEIDRFANGRAARFNIVGSFGPLIKSDNTKHVSVIFRAKEGEGALDFDEPADGS